MIRRQESRNAITISVDFGTSYDCFPSAHF